MHKSHHFSSKSEAEKNSLMQMYNQADNNKIKFRFGTSEDLLAKLDSLIYEKK